MVASSIRREYLNRESRLDRLAYSPVHHPNIVLACSYSDICDILIHRLLVVFQDLRY